jgi:hypothetical protein
MYERVYIWCTYIHEGFVKDHIECRANKNHGLNRETKIRDTDIIHYKSIIYRDINSSTRF